MASVRDFLPLVAAQKLVSLLRRQHLIEVDLLYLLGSLPPLVHQLLLLLKLKMGLLAALRRKLWKVEAIVILVRRVLTDFHVFNVLSV